MKSTNVNDPVDALVESYSKLIKQCYDALAEDVDQERRDVLREVLADFLKM